MENRSRPLWRRLVNSVTGAVAVLALGATVGGERRLRQEQTVAPDVQQGQGRDALLAQGWGTPTPQRLIKPTYWPFVLGLGIVFLLGGIATRFMISGIGLFIFALGMVGWMRDLLDEQESGEGV